MSTEQAPQFSWCPARERKMGPLLLLLLSAGALLYSAEAQGAYNQLPDDYKKGVDLVLRQLQSHAAVQHHFLFFRSLEKADIEVNLCVYLWVSVQVLE